MDQVIAGLNELVRSARATSAVQRGLLAGVVRAQAVVVADRLHLRFRMPPLQTGVLPSQFHWVLAGAVDGIDPGSVTSAAFPGPSAAGALAVSGSLV